MGPTRFRRAAPWLPLCALALIGCGAGSQGGGYRRAPASACEDDAPPTKRAEAFQCAAAASAEAKKLHQRATLDAAHCADHVRRRDKEAGRYAKFLALGYGLGDAEADFALLNGLHHAQWAQLAKDPTQVAMARVTQRAWGKRLPLSSTCDDVLESLPWIRELGPAATPSDAWRRARSRCVHHLQKVSQSGTHGPMVAWLLSRALWQVGVKPRADYRRQLMSVVMRSSLRLQVQVKRDCQGVGARVQALQAAPLGKLAALELRIDSCDREIVRGASTFVVRGSYQLAPLPRRGFALAQRGTAGTSELPTDVKERFARELTRRIQEDGSKLRKLWSDELIDEAARDAHHSLEKAVLAILWAPTNRAALQLLSQGLTLPQGFVSHVLRDAGRRPRRLIKWPQRPYMGSVSCQTLQAPAPKGANRSAP